MTGTGPDLSLVRRLKAKGRYDEAMHLLTAWLAGDPDNPILLYEMAVAFDNQGQEEEAIPYYRKALEAELDRRHRLDAILGLGSSLRVVGRVAESYQILSDGIAEYPRHLGMKVFYALTLERMGNFGDAIAQLLDVIVEGDRDDSLELYKPAMRYYREHRHDSLRNSTMRDTE